MRQDLLAGANGAVQLTEDELLKLSQFSRMVSPKRRVEEGKPLFEVTIFYVQCIKTQYFFRYKHNVLSSICC